MSVRRHELHTRQATGNQRPEECQPPGTIFSRSKVYPENLTVTFVVDTYCDKTRNVDNTAALTHWFALGYLETLECGEMRVTSMAIMLAEPTVRVARASRNCREVCEGPVSPLVGKANSTRSHKPPAPWASLLSWLINASAREVVSRSGACRDLVA